MVLYRTSHQHRLAEIVQPRDIFSFHANWSHPNICCSLFTLQTLVAVASIASTSSKDRGRCFKFNLCSAATLEVVLSLVNCELNWLRNVSLLCCASSSKSSDLFTDGRCCSLCLRCSSISSGLWMKEGRFGFIPLWDPAWIKETPPPLVCARSELDWLEPVAVESFVEDAFWKNDSSLALGATVTLIWQLERFDVKKFRRRCCCTRLPSTAGLSCSSLWRCFSSSYCWT